MPFKVCHFIDATEYSIDVTEYSIDVTEYIFSMFPVHWSHWSIPQHFEVSWKVLELMCSKH